MRSLYYWGYRLLRIKDGTYAYTTPEISIIKVYGGPVKIRTPLYYAIIEHESPIVGEIISGKFLEKVKKKNPHIVTAPKTPVDPKDNRSEVFDTDIISHGYKEPIYIRVGKDTIIIRAPFETKYTIHTNVTAILNDDYKLIIDTEGYKYRKLPCRNGYVKVFEPIEIEKAITKFKEEIPVKVKEPVFPTKWIEDLEPNKIIMDMSYQPYSPIEALITKEPLTASYTKGSITIIDIYYHFRHVKRIRGRKKEALNEAFIYLNMGEMITMV